MALDTRIISLMDFSLFGSWCSSVEPSVPRTLLEALCGFLLPVAANSCEMHWPVSAGWLGNKPLCTRHGALIETYVH